ncbi:hypothetical protein D6817_04140, partial [Candidatus Pacearchaeota archaeon]
MEEQARLRKKEVRMLARKEVRASRAALVVWAAVIVALVLANAEFGKGLGVTPARRIVNFAPGLEKSVQMGIVNSEAKQTHVVIAVQGELAQYVSLPTRELTLEPRETRSLSYRVRLPDELEPGEHRADIVVLELPENLGEGNTIGAAVAVVSQFVVSVPYPGKYAEASFDVYQSQGVVSFVTAVTSKGKFDLARVKARVEVFGALNEKVAELESEEVGIASQRRKELVVKWEPGKEVKPGKYRAVATLFYDGKTKTLEKEFSIARQGVSVEGIEVRDFRLGEIAKFEIVVRNELGEEISEAYGEVNVFDSESKELLASFRSPTQALEPGERAVLVAYWDTEGVKPGSYDAELIVRYTLPRSEKLASEGINKSVGE